MTESHTPRDPARSRASLPVDRAESIFKDYKPALSKDQAIAEANRCLFCTDAPCVQACPTHIDIPQFIRKIATGNEEGSARTIFSSNILGMTCARVCPVEVLCVGDCVYNDKGEPPIQIGKLQRYATDIAYEKGTQFFEAGADTGKSVGLVGAGPASLAAAHRLRRQGHRVTIYEKRSVVGGLNTTGVAPHKLRADASLEEVEWVLAIGGIDIQTGVSIGTDLSFEELEKRHDAVFVGAGLGADTLLDVEGKKLANIEGAVAWIERMKLEKLDVSKFQHCVVVGGGNTALDVVREARTLGIPKVTLLYRGHEAGMSGYEHEWESAKVEGVGSAWRLQPIGFDASADGKSVAGVKCVRLDESKKAIPGTEHVVPCDLVLLAIGQSTLGESSLGSLLAALPGVALEKGRVVTDEHGCTGRKGLFAGGDCRNGGKEVVNAVAEGDAAALAIDAYLKGKSHA